MTKDEWYDNLTVNDTLTMKAPNQQDWINLKTVWVTVPQPGPILRITQGIWGMKDFSCTGFLGSVSKTEITFGATYTNCVPSDIGKMVKDDGEDTAVLKDYDNDNKKWWLAGSASITSGSSMTIVNGTGTGTSSGNSSSGGGGAILMGHGLNGASDPPKISLVDSDSGYDTLYLKKFGGEPANLDLGDLTVHGKIQTGGPDLIIDGTHVQITKSNGLNIYVGVEKADDHCLVMGYHADYNIGYMYIYGDPWYSGLTIGNEGTCYFGHGVYPEPGSYMRYLGNWDLWWYDVYTEYLEVMYLPWWAAISDPARLDALKNCRPIVVQEKDGKTREVIDIESMNFLASDDGKGKSWSLNKVSGFLIGVCRDLVIEKEQQEQRIAELEQRLSTLETSANQKPD